MVRKTYKKKRHYKKKKKVASIAYFNPTKQNIFALLVTSSILAILFWVHSITGDASAAAAWIVIIFIVLIFFSRELYRKFLKKIFKKYRTMYALAKMHPLKFEKLIAEVIKSHDFSHIKLTPGSGDGGKDIIAYKNNTEYYIECKRHKGTLALSILRDFAHVVSDSNVLGLLVTTAKVSAGARSIAERYNIEIWDSSNLASKIWKYNENFSQKRTK